MISTNNYSNYYETKTNTQEETRPKTELNEGVSGSGIEDASGSRYDVSGLRVDIYSEYQNYLLKATTLDKEIAQDFQVILKEYNDAQENLISAREMLNKLDTYKDFTYERVVKDAYGATVIDEETGAPKLETVTITDFADLFIFAYDEYGDGASNPSVAQMQVDFDDMVEEMGKQELSNWLNDGRPGYGEKVNSDTIDRGKFKDMVSNIFKGFNESLRVIGYSSISDESLGAGDTILLGNIGGVISDVMDKAMASGGGGADFQLKIKAIIERMNADLASFGTTEEKRYALQQAINHY